MMDIFKKLIIFLLCVELVFSSMPSVFFVSQAQAQECPNGSQYDSSFNRCITQEQKAGVINATSRCAPEDKVCYKANAEAALKKGEEENKIEEELKNKGGLMDTPMKAAALAVPLFMVAQRLFKGKSRGQVKCKSLSLYMMLGAGAAIFIGDVWANSKHKKRLKKIKEEWEGVRGKDSKPESDNSNKDSTASLAQTSTNPDVRNAQAKESQSEAFEMMAKSEDSLASAAKFKSTIYGVGTLAFAGSSVISLLEHFRLNRLKAEMIRTSTAAPAQFPAAKARYVEYYQQVYCTNATPEAVDDPSDAYNQWNSDIQAAADDAADVAQRATEAAASGAIEAGGGSSPSQGFIGPPQRFQSLTDNFQAFYEDKHNSKLDIQNVQNAKTFADLLVLTEGVKDVAHLKRSPSLDEYENYKTFTLNSALEEPSVLSLAKQMSLSLISNLNPLSSALAEAELAAGEVSENGIVVTGQRVKTLGGLNKFLRAPLTRATISGVFAVWAGVMTMHARKQAKISKARAEYLRKMKNEFNESAGAIAQSSSSQGSLSIRPLSSGSLTNRASVTDSSGSIGIADQKVCMSNAGIDENCSCRSNNSCLSAAPSTFPDLGAGTANIVAMSTNPLGQITSGKSAAGSVDSAAAVNRAMRILDQSKKLQDKIPEISQGKGNKLAKSMVDSLMAISRGASAPQLSSLSSGNPFNLSPSKATEALEKELASVSDNKPEAATSRTIPAKDLSLEFGLTPDQLAADKTALSEMNQNLDYGENDINTASNQNIFEVLSNRYRRSGMKRLLDTNVSPD